MLLPATNTSLSLLRNGIPASYRRDIRGKLTRASPAFLHQPLSPGRVRGAKGAGIRFERGVVSELTAVLPFFAAGIPFAYWTSRGDGRRFCIPDGIAVSEGEVIIFEVKLRHCLTAWFQLQNLYIPVVEMALQRKVKCIEVVKWFDPEVRFPEEVKVTNSLSAALNSSQACSVLIWPGKGR